MLHQFFFAAFFCRTSPFGQLTHTLGRVLKKGEMFGEAFTSNSDESGNR